MSTDNHIGIDLGTTNSAIVCFDGESFRVFKNRLQMEVTPSAVLLDKKGRIVVGQKAYEMLSMTPGDVAIEFKRIMGTKSTFNFESAARSMTPEELSAEVLKSLLADAQRFISCEIMSAVITIPAAFKAAQCESTNRAATLAGLQEIHLLMEPVAAAVTFCGTQLDNSRKWLVYDLGGGTFDAALVAQQDNILTVVEHSGNNMLGGKNLDDRIIDELLLPRLRQEYSVPLADKSAREFIELRRRLKTFAEGAKIELSSAASGQIDIYDIGTDTDGKEYEITIQISRAEIERIASPMIFDTIHHCQEILTSANTEASEIESVLLIGGPTQMPMVREMIQEELNIPVDFSVDPMTAVARGAALYASTVRTSSPVTVPATGPNTLVSDLAILNVSYQSVTSVLDPLVVVKMVSQPPSNERLELCIENQDGVWHSGWIPLTDSQCETHLQLRASTTNIFQVMLRDERGKRVNCEPNEIVIRHGVEFDDFRLPHTIGVKVVAPDGSEYIDPIFARNSSLPDSERKRYLSEKSLLPKSNDSIDIPIYEGEVLDRPDANDLLLTVRILGEEVSRPIAEGTPIDLLVDISTSRILKVSAYVEILGKEFSERYVPDDEKQDVRTVHARTQAQLQMLYRELEYLEDNTSRVSDVVGNIELTQIRDKIHTVDMECAEISDADLQLNPDRVKQVHEQVQRLGRQLYQLKQRDGLKAEADLESLISQFEASSSEVRGFLGETSDNSLIRKFNKIYKDGHHCHENNMVPGLKKCLDQMNEMKWRLRFNSFEYLEGSLEYFTSIKATLRNRAEADRLLNAARYYADAEDKEALRETVRGLWDLLPDRQAQEEARRSGIRAIKDS